MDKLHLVDKLKAKVDISYEEAKKILESNNWDLLDSIIYLERIGKIEKPEAGTFYTNESKNSYHNEDKIEEIIEEKEQYHYSKDNKHFNVIFETICKVIDILNNISLEVIRKGKTLVKLPSTVIIVLLFFAFWIVIPLIVIGIFFDMEFLLSSKINKYEQIETVNKVFKGLSKNAKLLKEKINKRV